MENNTQSMAQNMGEHHVNILAEKAETGATLDRWWAGMDIRWNAAHGINFLYSAPPVFELNRLTVLLIIAAIRENFHQCRSCNAWKGW